MLPWELLLSSWKPDSNSAIEAVHRHCNLPMKKYKLVTVEKQLGLWPSYSCSNAQINLTIVPLHFIFS